MRQFRRELTANPKKAAVLGLLAVVALYFWAPLVLGWVKGATAAAPTAEAKPSDPVSAGASVQSAAAPGKSGIPDIAWHELVHLMDGDPRTLAANLVMERRDPFAPPKGESQPTKPEPEATSLPLTVTPQSLGLALSSTIIGSSRRLARINGRTYEEGQSIDLVKEGREISFVLAEVHPRKVVLKREDARFELTIPDPSRSRRIELSGKQ